MNKSSSSLGSLLIDDHILSENEVQTLSEACGAFPSAFAKALLAVRTFDEVRLHNYLLTRTTYDDSGPFDAATIHPNAMNCLELPLLAYLEVVPLSLEGDVLRVAMLDPLDLLVTSQIRFFGRKKVKPLIARSSDIQKTLSQLISHFEPRESPLKAIFKHMPAGGSASSTPDLAATGPGLYESPSKVPPMESDTEDLLSSEDLDFDEGLSDSEELSGSGSASREEALDLSDGEQLDDGLDLEMEGGDSLGSAGGEDLDDIVDAQDSGFEADLTDSPVEQVEVEVPDDELEMSDEFEDDLDSGDLELSASDASSHLDLPESDFFAGGEHGEDAHVEDGHGEDESDRDDNQGEEQEVDPAIEPEMDSDASLDVASDGSPEADESSKTHEANEIHEANDTVEPEDDDDLESSGLGEDEDDLLTESVEEGSAGEPDELESEELAAEAQVSGSDDIAERLDVDEHQEAATVKDFPAIDSEARGRAARQVNRALLQVSLGKKPSFEDLDSALRDLGMVGLSLTPLSSEVRSSEELEEATVDQQARFGYMAEARDSADVAADSNASSPGDVAFVEDQISGFEVRLAFTIPPDQFVQELVTKMLSKCAKDWHSRSHQVQPKGQAELMSPAS